MGLNDLKELFEKKNVILTVLFFWLIIGLTAMHFNLVINETSVGIIILYPLLIICMVLFIYAFFFRGDVDKISWKNLLKSIIFFACAFGAYYLIGELLLTLLLSYFLLLMFIVAIITFVFITAFFSMIYGFELGVKVDNAYKKVPIANFFMRWGMFIGGALLAIFLVVILPVLLVQQGVLTYKKIESQEINFMLLVIPYVFLISVLGLIGLALIIVLIKRRINAWLGIFFIFAAIYVNIYMISALLTLKGGGTVPRFISTLIIYCFDIFLLLITASTLIGYRADLIKEKLKFIKRDAIFLWAILAKASYEFSEYLLTAEEVMWLKSIFVIFLLIVIMLLIGGYYLIKYSGKIKAGEIEEG